MVRYDEMRVETPYNLADVDDRSIKPGHSEENQCTYCGVGSEDDWYPIADITVYRIWLGEDASRGRNDGGSVWQWRCPEHPKRAWAPHSHEAPADLLPIEPHPCEEVDRLSRRRCGVGDGTRKFLDGWFCGAHSYPYELNDKQRRLLGDDDPEAGQTPV